MNATPVLLVHYGEDWIRGSERCLLDLLAHLDRSRFTPLLWCNSPTLAAEAATLGVETMVEPFSLLLGWQAPRFDLAAHRRLSRRARELITERQIGLVHANSAAPCQWLAGVCRALQVPLVCHLHARYQPRDRFSLRVHQASVLIGVSEPVLTGWRQDGCAADRLIRVPNGVDAARLNAGAHWPVVDMLGLPPGELIIATVGSLIKRKGIDLLIRSLAALTESGEGARLLVIGCGPEREALMALASELGVAERVHFLGERPDSAAILRGGVDLLVSGAREEVFGLTLAEAGMLGLAVSAYRVGGIPEVVAEGVSGLLATPGDWIEMADHWRQLSNPQTRCAMGRAGQQRAAQLFTVDRYVEKITAVWGDALAGRWRSTSQSSYGTPYASIVRWAWQRLVAQGRSMLTRGLAEMVEKVQAGFGRSKLPE
ncbi:glycosyltransferase family 4 protein [Aeromonas salmonicida subsp. salmonicida]|nr:glycosyltransferase family 4 protein [Aeromonas salmonicida subsp. salmonicida]